MVNKVATALCVWLTVLMYAASNGHLAIVHLLQQSGATK